MKGGGNRVELREKKTRDELIEKTEVEHREKKKEKTREEL